MMSLLIGHYSTYRMTRRLLILYAFLGVNLVSAQNKSFNDRYVEVSVSLVATDIQEALRVSDSLLRVAKTDDERAKAYMLSANIHQNLGKKAIAIQRAIYADEIVKAALNPAWQAVTAGFLATSFRQVGLLNAAGRYTDQAERANNMIPKHPMYTLTKINILHERALQAIALDDYEIAEREILKAGKLVVFDGREDKRAKLIKATNHQLLGLCYLYLGNFTKAKELYRSALAQIGDDESNLRPYIFRGLAEVALGQDSLDDAHMYLKKAESYIETNGFEELRRYVYHTFSKYYWRMEGVDNAKKYDDLYKEVREKEAKEARKVTDELFENIYQAKEAYKNKFKTAAIMVLCLVVVTIFSLLYSFFLDRKYRMHQPMGKGNKKDVDVNREIPDVEDAKSNEVRSINMSKETEQRLLTDIDKYEENLYFLDKNISLNAMAKDLNTNQRYVSYIIRKYRGKDFYGYIQTCRIQFIIDRMKADPSLLDYKLAHLADMSGFTNLSKFSIAFKAETGLPPSAFVHFKKKELGKR